MKYRSSCKWNIFWENHSKHGFVWEENVCVYKYILYIYIHIIDIKGKKKHVFHEASWSPSCFSKVLGGMEPPIARNFSVTVTTPPSPSFHKQFGRGLNPSRDTVSNSTGTITGIHLLHFALWSPYFTCWTLHSASCTLHSTLDMLHLPVSALYTPHFTR